MKKYDINWDNFFRFLNKLSVTCFFSSEIFDVRYEIDERGNRLIKVPYFRPTKLFIKDSKRIFWAFAIEVLHDCGHLIVAPEERRDRPNFGIPEDAEGVEEWDIEEMKACLVEQELCDLLQISKRFKRNLFRDNRFRHLCRGQEKEIRQWWRDRGKKLTNAVFAKGLD